MKKILGGLFSLILCGFIFSGCGTPPVVSTDLDGNGVVEKWEEIYTATNEIDYTNKIDQIKSELESGYTLNVVNVSSASDFRAISNNVNSAGEFVKYAFILKSDLDLNGETIECINLGTHYLFGNNHFVKNFKLKTSYSMTNTQSSKDNDIIHTALIKNGSEVRDLRIFMGMQTFYNEVYKFNKADLSTSYYALDYSYSIFRGTEKLNNIDVKGYFNINRHIVKSVVEDNNNPDAYASTGGIRISLLSADGTNYNIKSDGTIADSIISKTKEISNCSIDGKITLNDEFGSLDKAEENSYINESNSVIYDNSEDFGSSYIGGVMPIVANNCVIKDCNVNLQLNCKKLNSDNNVSVGGIAGKCYGKILCANVKLLPFLNAENSIEYNKYGITANETDNKFSNFGGAVGELSGSNSEILNANANITMLGYNSSITDFADMDNITYQLINLGGLVGRAIDSAISYCNVNGDISQSFVTKINCGGLIGYANNCYIYKNISRVNSKLENCLINNVANYIGYSSYGLLDSNLSIGNVNVVNTIVGSSNDLGTIVDTYPEINTGFVLGKTIINENSGVLEMPNITQLAFAGLINIEYLYGFIPKSSDLDKENYKINYKNGIILNSDYDLTYKESQNIYYPANWIRENIYYFNATTDANLNTELKISSRNKDVANSETEYLTILSKVTASNFWNESVDKQVSGQGFSSLVTLLTLNDQTEVENSNNYKTIKFRKQQPVSIYNKEIEKLNGVDKSINNFAPLPLVEEGYVGVKRASYYDLAKFVKLALSVQINQSGEHTVYNPYKISNLIINSEVVNYYTNAESSSFNVKEFVLDNLLSALSSLLECSETTDANYKYVFKQLKIFELDFQTLSSTDGEMWIVGNSISGITDADAYIYDGIIVENPTYQLIIKDNNTELENESNSFTFELQLKNDGGEFVNLFTIYSQYINSKLTLVFNFNTQITNWGFIITD